MDKNGPKIFSLWKIKERNCWPANFFEIWLISDLATCERKGQTSQYFDGNNIVRCVFVYSIFFKPLCFFEFENFQIDKAELLGKKLPFSSKKSLKKIFHQWQSCLYKDFLVKRIEYFWTRITAIQGGLWRRFLREILTFGGASPRGPFVLRWFTVTSTQYCWLKWYPFDQNDKNKNSPPVEPSENKGRVVQRGRLAPLV